MARIVCYPHTVRNVNGNVGIYRGMEEIEYITNNYDTYGHWGNQDPGAGYMYAVASVNGGKHKPSQIEGTNFAELSAIPDNAKITAIGVEYAYAKFAYPNMGHGSFGQPVISLDTLGLHIYGNAPPKDTVTDYAVWWNNLQNIVGSDLRDLKLTFDVPMNTSTNPAYIKMKHLRVHVEYVVPNYVPQVRFELNKIEYGGVAAPVTVEVIDTNNASPTGNVEVVVHITNGLNIVSGSIDAQGTYNPQTLIWNARVTNGKAKLTFKVTPSSPSICGLENVNAAIFKGSDVHTSYESIYIIPQKTFLLDCSVSENAIKQSLTSRHYTLFNLEIQNNARTETKVHLDFDNLKINGSLPGYDASTKTLTITNWDANNYYVVQLQLYSTTLEDAQIICYSDAWDGVTKIKVNVNEEFDYEEYYTELDAPLFTLENMYQTNGEQYYFGCLCRITGTSSITKGMKNVRASVVNNGEKFTQKVSQIGDWQLLAVKFTYNENSKLSFRFYGNYIEEDRGKVEFGNLFVIHADHYGGYEYPALAFDDLDKLIINDEYTNLLLEPPEKNPSSKHYFDLMDWMGLEGNEYLIPHGIEITGDIQAEEAVNLICGFGHKQMDELEFFTQSLNVGNTSQNFRIGGKFKTLGLRFPDIPKVLADLMFWMQIDDSFDNQTPLNVQMKNVRITLYYTLNNDCWEFFVNGISSKYYLLDLSAESEIPRGANYDVNKFKVDGADGEFPNRINLEDNKIKLKFSTCDCATIEELTEILEEVVEWLYPERDNLDNPLLKTISFFYAPDRGYDYYIEDTIDAEAVDGAYECEVELIVPSGLARSLEETESASIGSIGHMGKVRPTIFFNILSHDGDIMLVESDSNQKFILNGTFIDNLPIDTQLKLDCKEKKLYYESYGEWFLIDPNNIALESDFFVLKKHFDFSASVNCRVSDVKYYELRG